MLLPYFGISSRCPLFGGFFFPFEKKVTNFIAVATLRLVPPSPLQEAELGCSANAAQLSRPGAPSLDQDRLFSACTHGYTDLHSSSGVRGSPLLAHPHPTPPPNQYTTITPSSPRGPLTYTTFTLTQAT